MTTRCYYINSLDPYFNLAIEEYLLKNCTDDIFMLWRGESSIVVGKHQNALAEINHAHVAEKRLKVARRLSGGGTVFHDPGNINFTFIRHVEQLEKLNYAMFLDDVKAVLCELGLAVYNSERDDLMLDGFKISGNAQHVHKHRVLHHGTLLFDSDLSDLKKALRVDLSRFEHKAVQSNRSAVANIRRYLTKDMDVDTFFNYMFSRLLQLLPHAHQSMLTPEEISAITELRNAKYAQWDWIYGYSPKYSYTNRQADASLGVYLEVEKGLIKLAKFEGFSSEVAWHLSCAMVGCRHEINEIRVALLKMQKLFDEENLLIADLLDLFFGES
ncbi:MAG: lipoate--protein ligase [Mangrovibacterium sp.]